MNNTHDIAYNGYFYLTNVLLLNDHLFIAGHETKSMLNNSGPRYKRSKIERKMNTDVLFCVVLLFFMCLIAALGKVKRTSPTWIHTLHTEQKVYYCTSAYRTSSRMTLSLHAQNKWSFPLLWATLLYGQIQQQSTEIKKKCRYHLSQFSRPLFAP